MFQSIPRTLPAIKSANTKNTARSFFENERTTKAIVCSHGSSKRLRNIWNVEISFSFTKIVFVIFWKRRGRMPACLPAATSGSAVAQVGGRTRLGRRSKQTRKGQAQF